MKVVIDTNVLIAAFATQGLCHSVFELCLDQHQIVLSDQILREASSSFKKKLKVPESVLNTFISFLRINTHIIKNVSPLQKKICRDSDDDSILALAEQIKSDYLITGDQDLLVLKEYCGIPIIQPRQFWEIIRNEEKK